MSVVRIPDLPLEDAREAVLEHLLLARIQVLAIPPEASDLALNPSYRFGKG